MKNGAYHLHRRKRVHNKLERYPHKNKWIRTLDNFLMMVALIGPVMDFPQLFKIYYLKNAAGVSLITWVLYTIICIPWLAYGLVHKEKPIILAYSLWLVSNLVVVCGILLYS